MTIKFYQVGGSVRDEILGVKSKDIDFAVEAPSYEAMRDEILARGGKIFLETPQYLTIRANVPTLGATDYVLCRKDGSYSDGRRPDTVEPGTILDDLARRDFTMNAIAKDSETGEIIDPFGGQYDLSQMRISCVGDARTRFSEDGLRILRALRFSVTKKMQLSLDILDVLEDFTFVEEMLGCVSTERVREEMFKMFMFDTVEALRQMQVHQRIALCVFGTHKLRLKPTMEQ